MRASVLGFPASIQRKAASTPHDSASFCEQDISYGPNFILFSIISSVHVNVTSTPQYLFVDELASASIVWPLYSSVTDVLPFFGAAGWAIKGNGGKVSLGFQLRLDFLSMECALRTLREIRGLAGGEAHFVEALLPAASYGRE